jgi:hypothetical protein
VTIVNTEHLLRLADELADDAYKAWSLRGGSALIPSTEPTTVRWMPVIPVPGLKLTSAVTSSACGGVSALASPLDSAIEKHAECAAAMSSSGLVLPFGSSAREGQETPKVPIPEESKVVSPEPSNRVPVQTVLAVRSVMSLLGFSSAPRSRPAGCRGSLRPVDPHLRRNEMGTLGKRMAKVARSPKGKKLRDEVMAKAKDPKTRARLKKKFGRKR